MCSASEQLVQVPPPQQFAEIYMHVSDIEQYSFVLSTIEFHREHKHSKIPLSSCFGRVFTQALLPLLKHALTNNIRLKNNALQSSLVEELFKLLDISFRDETCGVWHVARPAQSSRRGSTSSTPRTPRKRRKSSTSVTPKSEPQTPVKSKAKISKAGSAASSRAPSVPTSPKQRELPPDAVGYGAVGIEDGSYLYATEDDTAPTPQTASSGTAQGKSVTSAAPAPVAAFKASDLRADTSKDSVRGRRWPLTLRHFARVDAMAAADAPCNRRHASLVEALAYNVEHGMLEDPWRSPGPTPSALELLARSGKHEFDPLPVDAHEVEVSDQTRDAAAKREILSGKVKVEVLSNVMELAGKLDGGASAVLGDKLIGIRNLFTRGLRGMPRSYITRVVFDSSHKTLCLVRDSQVVAGISFRLFASEKLIEIVFVAVDAREQVKGYGTYLMNHLKSYAVKNGCDALVTYADNDAVGYFRKQGFVDELKLPPERLGVVKLYTGGVIMECMLNPNVPYLNQLTMVAKQLKNAKQHMSEHDRTHATHPGMLEFAEGKSFVRLEEIPGVTAADLQSINKGSHAVLDKKTLTWMKRIVSELKRMPDAEPFLEPVDGEAEPNYYNVITNPMDLSTIERKIKNKDYPSKQAFLDDFKLMFDNCRYYNSPESIFVACADKLARALE